MVLDGHVRDGSALAHGRNRITHHLLVGQDVTQLLDYGCGQAEVALAAANELGVTVYACDIDPNLIEDLKREHGSSVSFFTISENQPTLPIGDKQMSAVICCEVLEHMSEASRAVALAEMRRILRDDGVLIVTTPHKGLFSAADPENAKFHFPRIHKYVYYLTKGREKYMRRYEGERFGNFSAGAERHAHFSRRELGEIVGRAGFRVDEVRYFTLIYPFIRASLWMAESMSGRIWGANRLTALFWRVYTWDADLEPGRLACSIAIRARKA
jgi:ubiquinone/menaquinone biosynthesis C-methylase UbiE